MTKKVVWFLVHIVCSGRANGNTASLLVEYSIIRFYNQFMDYTLIIVLPFSWGGAIS